MKLFWARLLRYLCMLPGIKKHYFGIHKRYIAQSSFFTGVKDVITYRDGIRLELKLDDWLQQQVYFTGDYEKEEIDFLYRTLSADDIFVDVGANMGLFTLNAASILTHGKVYSFEAFSYNFRQLKCNVERNTFTNIVLENIAVSNDQKGIEIRYNASDKNLGMASGYLSRYNTVEKVKSIRLDDYFQINPIQNITCIKIDIEGGELEALKGMQNILRNFQPILLMEINEVSLSQAGTSTKDVLDFLSACDYQQNQILSRNSTSYNAVFVSN